MTNQAKKSLFYALAFIVSYIFPLTYYILKYGVIKTEEKSSIVFPIVLISALGIIKIASDIPRWVSTWEPSFKKGLMKALPKLLLFLFFVTFGLLIKYIAERSVAIAFFTYFETILVIFGGQLTGAIFGAYHLKYKELYLIEKGYVLGVVNR